MDKQIIYKPLHRKLKIKHHVPLCLPKKVDSGAPEGLVVHAPVVISGLLLLLLIHWQVINKQI
jgi:hypothetical protein